MAYFHRQMTGKGQHVDVSAQASTAWSADTAPFYWEADGTMTKRVGNAIAGRSIHGAVMKAAYPCKDGYICWLIYGARAGGITNKETVKWMEERGITTDWLKAQNWDKFAPAHPTQEDFDRIMKPVSQFLENTTKGEFLEEVVKRRIMEYPVSTARGNVESPQLSAREVWEKVEHPELSNTITYPRSWANFSESSFNLHASHRKFAMLAKSMGESEIGRSIADLAPLLLPP